MIARGEKMRIGFSKDIHKLVEGRPLILGGVEIPSLKGSLAHSDGDVLIHAIVDALIGAMSLGDIGELFPDTDEMYKGISSLYFLDKIQEIIKEKGFEVENIDSLIVLESPKLKKYKKQMEDKIAKHLNVDVSKVNVKAGTNEGLDASGRGEAIEAYATVLLRKVC